MARGAALYFKCDGCGDEVHRDERSNGLCVGCRATFGQIPNIEDLYDHEHFELPPRRNEDRYGPMTFASHEDPEDLGRLLADDDTGGVRGWRNDE